MQALQVTEAELADKDSRFRVFDGLTVHYKAAAPPAAAPGAHETPCGLAMYHGFGANTFSWSYVDKRLAEQLGVIVVSHDMPGFGLTQRSVGMCCFTPPATGRRAPDHPGVDEELSQSTQMVANPLDKCLPLMQCCGLGA